jgi:TatD DNase family protein
MIDSHAHIYLEEFDSERQVVVQKAIDAGVERILMPAVDSTTHEAMLQVEDNFPVCLSMIGLHPCSVKENYTNELATVEAHLTRRSFIAIGEIGLDFYWDKTFAVQQYEAFNHQIKIALKA